MNVFGKRFFCAKKLPLLVKLSRQKWKIFPVKCKKSWKRKKSLFSPKRKKLYKHKVLGGVFRSKTQKNAFFHFLEPKSGFLRFFAPRSTFSTQVAPKMKKSEKCEKVDFLCCQVRKRIYIYVSWEVRRGTFRSKRTFAIFSILERKKRKSAQKPKIPRKNAKFRTFSPFRENELKIPIKGIGFNRPWEPCAFFAFWSEKGGKVRFFAKKCDFSRKSAKFR